MKRQLLSAVTIALACALAVSGQTHDMSPPTRSPREVVELLWAMATRGDLLTSDGWSRASAFFTVPQPHPTNKPILVVSNYYGINLDNRNGDRAEIQVEYVDCGQIDSELRYSPPRKTQASKTSFGYRLVSVPTYVMVYGSDGKTLVEKRPTGSAVWQIEGSQADGPPPARWTTVNTAIRYVLEVQNKTTDSVVKKNADETLAKLMALH